MKTAATLLTLVAVLLIQSLPSLSQDVIAQRRGSHLFPEEIASNIAKARGGDSAAALKLGEHYMETGEGHEALKWLRVAAIMGKEIAQHMFYAVARMHADLDESVEIEAVLWLEKACLTYQPARDTKAAALEYHGTLQSPDWKKREGTVKKTK